MSAEANTTAAIEGPFAEGAIDELRMLRDKILFTLEVYPFLSKSHLHMSLGTSTSRRLWIPVLEGLIEERLVCLTTLQAKTPLDRNQNFEVYHLAKIQYEPTAQVTISPPAVENQAA